MRFPRSLEASSPFLIGLLEYMDDSGWQFGAGFKSIFQQLNSAPRSGCETPPLLLTIR